MEAAGGVPPYSYQWKVYYIGKGNWGGFFNWWYNCYSPLTNANDSTYYATMGNYAYYCVVTDDAGGQGHQREGRGASRPVHRSAAEEHQSVRQGINQ